ncbi:RHOD [Musa troglodytarum]|uniref:RHOD n=1 Tax=Musa troglodytarum TaxID=320322 RepID=A0A9E7G8E3_9LILI|nr:RHOD [Musa troglodytarum]
MLSISGFALLRLPATLVEDGSSWSQFHHRPHHVWKSSATPSRRLQEEELECCRSQSRSLLTVEEAIHPRLSANVRMDAAVGGEEEETRQAKEMAAARRRWETLIREQKVKVLTPREAGYAIQLSNKTLLDVRPSTEHEKVVGGVAALCWCMTDLLLLANNFILQVSETYSGYKEVWKLLMKSWTDQQRAVGAREGWSYRLVSTGRLLGLIVLADALFFGAQRLGPLLQEWRFV